MTATSVTGVGLGSADKKQKGSEHMRLGAEKIIGPRVVYADTITLDGSGNGVVHFPTLSGVAGDYIVTANDTNTSAAAAVGVVLTFGASDTVVTFKGTASHTVQFSVVKTGLAV